MIFFWTWQHEVESRGSFWPLSVKWLLLLLTPYSLLLIGVIKQKPPHPHQPFSLPLMNRSLVLRSQNPTIPHSQRTSQDTRHKTQEITTKPIFILTLFLSPPLKLLSIMILVTLFNPYTYLPYPHFPHLFFILSYTSISPSLH